MLRDKRLYHISANARYSQTSVVVRFVFMKALSLFYMAGIPCIAWGIPKGLFLFVLAHLVCGECLATMFIVNHVIEGVAFARREVAADGSVKPSPPTTTSGEQPMAETANGKVEANDWAAVQCQTSVNWSSGSWFWNHFSGGLNHQIEHHLFPSIAHTNYVLIQPVVEETCKEFGVPYRSEPSLFAAYKGMMRHLKALGNED